LYGIVYVEIYVRYLEFVSWGGVKSKGKNDLPAPRLRRAGKVEM